MPKISVIMPVYNAERFLREAIDSILNQTFSDFEFIIVNDGSTDRSEEIILSYKDPRIVYQKNEQNLGLIATLNKAILLCNGEYIARMDNDDISELDRFEVQLGYFLVDKSTAMVCSPIVGITSSGKTRDHWPIDFETKTSKAIKNTLPWQNCISHPTVLIKSDILKSYKYNSNQKGSEDWDLWLRLVRDKHKILKTEEVLLRYRFHHNSITRLHNQQQSPQIKSSLVKIRFFLTSLLSGRINFFVFKTVFTIYKDLGYHLKSSVVPMALRKIKWCLTINPFLAYRQFKVLNNSITNYSSEYFLFFPYSHIGGAEKVHAEITKLLASEKPFVFITGIDNHARYPEQFGSEVILLDVAKCLYHPAFSKKAFKLIFNKIVFTNSSIVFGCNNLFFYDLLMKLPDTVYAVDLTHDYDYSRDRKKAVFYLESFLRCNYRIFISNDALQRTKDFYKESFVEDEFFERLKLIYNCVASVNHSVERAWQAPYKIIYVGRDTKEKRVDLIFELANICAIQNLPFDFTLVGPIKPRTQFSHLKNVSLLGVINDSNQIYEHYRKAHFVIISSLSEGFPLTLMEGMANGCVPLSTAVGDIPFHIKHADNGLLVSSGREEQILEELKALLAAVAAKKFSLEDLSLRAKVYTDKHFGRDNFKIEYSKVLRLK